MATIGKWPTRGIGFRWYKGSGPCPDKLDLLADYTFVGSIPPGPCWIIAANFAGRGKVGHSCGGSDTYVTEWSSGNNRGLSIDVWKAHADGIWTSSVAIQVYVAGYAALGLSAQVWAYPTNNFAGYNVTKSSCWLDGTLSGCNAIGGWLCPTNLSATVTVYDDGSLSIA